jgi:hypothetical protein
VAAPDPAPDRAADQRRGDHGHDRSAERAGAGEVARQAAERGPEQPVLHAVQRRPADHGQQDEVGVHADDPVVGQDRRLQERADQADREPDVGAHTGQSSLTGTWLVIT